MKLILALLFFVFVTSCNKLKDSNRSESSSSPRVEEKTQLPAKIVEIQKLIRQLNTKTTIYDFYEKLDSIGVILDDEELLYGGASAGERYEGWDLKVEGSYILTMEATSFEPEYLWEVKIIKHSIDKLYSKPIGCWEGAETVFPYFLKGHLMWKDVKPWEVEAKE